MAPGIATSSKDATSSCTDYTPQSDSWLKSLRLFLFNHTNHHWRFRPRALRGVYLQTSLNWCIILPIRSISFIMGLERQGKQLQVHNTKKPLMCLSNLWSHPKVSISIALPDILVRCLYWRAGFFHWNLPSWALAFCHCEVPRWVCLQFHSRCPCEWPYVDWAQSKQVDRSVRSEVGRILVDASCPNSGGMW